LADLSQAITALHIQPPPVISCWPWNVYFCVQKNRGSETGTAEAQGSGTEALNFRSGHSFRV